MVTRTLTWTLAFAAAGWLAGCAATGERAARASWDDVRKQHYTRRELDDTHAVEADLPERASLTQVLALAEDANPGLRAAFERWTAALAKVPQAKSLPDPRLSYAYFIESVETRVGPQRQRFGVSQTIPLFGKLGLRGEIAVHDANAAGAQFERARQDLRFRVVRLWSDYYYLSRAISITEENVNLLSHLESVALTQYSAGRTPHAAVIRAQVELGKLEVRLLTLRDQRRPTLAALNAALNRPAATAIAVPESIRATGVDLSPDVLREMLLADNPQLAALRFMVDKETAAAKLAGKGPIPDLTLGAEYVDTDPARVHNVADSGKNAAMATAMINVPLWFGRYRADRAEANARRSASEAELSELQNRLTSELERVHYELRDAERHVALYAYTLLPRARQSLEVTEEAFTAGEADFLDLVDAQRTLLEFELAYERALADRATTRAQLDRIVGRQLAGR